MLRKGRHVPYRHTLRSHAWWGHPSVDHACPWGSANLQCSREELLPGNSQTKSRKTCRRTQNTQWPVGQHMDNVQGTGGPPGTREAFRRTKPTPSRQWLSHGGSPRSLVLLSHASPPGVLPIDVLPTSHHAVRTHADSSPNPSLRILPIFYVVSIHACPWPQQDQKIHLSNPYQTIDHPPPPVGTIRR